MRYTVKQVAEMSGLTAHTLRYYTDMDLLPCQRDGANRRIFDEESLNWLEGIICLRKCGVSIEAIKEYCDLCRKGDDTLAARYEFMREQQKTAVHRLMDAQKLVDYMDHKVKHYEDVMTSRAPDDTNPATRTVIQPCEQ